MDLIVTVRELHYAGKARLRGERFQASEGDGKLLKLLKKAEDPPVHTGPVGQVASTAPVIVTQAASVADDVAEELVTEEPVVEPVVEPAVEPAAEPAPESAPEPEAAADPNVPAEASPLRYRTRRMTAKD